MYALLKNINSVPEKEVSKGIYITDYRKQATLMPPQDLKLNGSLEMQAIEITTLETSIRYLIRSNIELTEANKEDPCPEYIEAMEENKIVIKKKQAQLKELKELYNKAMESMCESTARLNSTMNNDAQQQLQSADENDDGMYL